MDLESPDCGAIPESVTITAAKFDFHYKKKLVGVL